MSLTIRKATEADTDALFRVCLHTADAGKSAAALHDFPELPGLTYAVPYLTRKATWAFVLEEENTKEVVGYIVGSYNTQEYDQDVLENWFPVHAIRYLHGSPYDSPDTKPADKNYLKNYKNPIVYKAPDYCIKISPAHMHINILAEHQGKGWGVKMIATAVEYLREKGIEGMWLGLDSRNVRGKKFYERIGFRGIEGAPGDVWLGLKFADFNN